MNAYYKMYLDETIALARTIIFKFSPLITTLNKEVINAGLEVDPDVPSSWRYYRHLSGQYHPVDTEMTITSLDTGETIVFNQANLVTHKKTKSVYSNIPSYVRKLKTRYPTQTILIDGILNPIDINTAIAAKDGTIFTYNAGKVEAQESSLIRDIERWIRSINYRFVMEAYAETDDLYIADCFLKIYAQMVPAIMSIRNRYIKTAEAHSFHVRAYLESHNRLGQYLPYLNREQRLFLYRNIAHIEHNTGMAATHDKLIEKLMTLRSLPVYSYDLRQKGIELVDSLSPEPVFVRTPVNLNTAIESRNVDEYSIDEISYKQITAALDNAEYVEQYIEDAKNKMAVSSISTLPTKLMEAAGIDSENLEQFGLLDVVLAQWMEMAADEKYVYVGEFEDPVTGVTLRLDTKELWVLFIYAVMAGSWNIELTKIPPMLAADVAKLDWIPGSEFEALLPKDKWDLNDSTIDFFINTQHELIGTVISPDDFLSLCELLLKHRRARWYAVHYPARFSKVADRRRLYRHCYYDCVRDFKTQHYRTYKEFFDYIGFDAQSMTSDGWKDLAEVLLDTATGYNSANIITLSEIQNAMVKIFTRLSSYTIQFLKGISSNASAVSDPTTVIPDTTLGDEHGTVFVPAPNNDGSAKIRERVSVEVQIPTVGVLEVTEPEKSPVSIDIGLDVDMYTAETDNFIIILPTVSVVDYQIN